MKTTRILTIAVVLLLITNLVLVAFMVTGKKNPVIKETRVSALRHQK